MSIFPVFLVNRLWGFNWQVAFFKYFYPTFDVGFLLLALFTYSLIFHKFHKSELRLMHSGTPTTSSRRSTMDRTSLHRETITDERPPRTEKRLPKTEAGVPTKKLDNDDENEVGRVETVGKVSRFQLFRASKFHTSVLLVLTFVVFLIVPDLTFLFYGILGERESEDLFHACCLSFTFANMTDVLIYLLLHPRVRKELKDMVKSRRKVNASYDLTESSRRLRDER